MGDRGSGVTVGVTGVGLRETMAGRVTGSRWVGVGAGRGRIKITSETYTAKSNTRNHMPVYASSSSTVQPEPCLRAPWLRPEAVIP
eukprot:1967350-Rhodomonas_salina.1